MTTSTCGDPLIFALNIIVCNELLSATVNVLIRFFVFVYINFVNINTFDLHEFLARLVFIYLNQFGCRILKCTHM